MGATTDFATELYNDFRQDMFFEDAVQAIQWEEDSGSTFDPVTGQVTENKVTHTAQVFSASSGDTSQQPKGISFSDIQVNDQFAKVLTAEFKIPPNGQQVQWKGTQYTVIEVIQDAIDATALIQLRQ